MAVDRPGTGNQGLSGTLQVFPDARNAFDFRGIPAVVKRRGFTQGSNPKAAAAAWREALQFLKR